MKPSTIFCAILGLVFSAQIISLHTSASSPMTETLAEEAYLEDNHASSGMFFSSANVVEEYEYDDAYCLLYDDADANMFNVEICVDLETYQMVRDAIKDNHELVGQLVLNDDYSFDGVEVFTFMPEPEFEMANASAKRNAKECVIPMYQLSF